MNCDEFQHQFTYEGQKGPANWAKYCPDCGGSQQSPINIVTSTVHNHSNPVSVDYSTKPPIVEMVNNGHTIKVPYTVGSLTYDGVTYYSKQYHFHAPSEHTINSRHAGIEMHVVHQSPAGEFAVLGFMIEPAAKGWPAVDQLFEQFKHVPNKGDTYQSFGAYVSSLFPTHHQWYLYDGSLTTPPCTEGLKWFVLSEPSYISQTLYEQIMGIMSGNNRPVQPLNGRVVSHTAQGRVV